MIDYNTFFVYCHDELTTVVCMLENKVNVLSFTDDIAKTAFLPGQTYDMLYVYEFIKSRVFEEGRGDARDILDYFDIEYYNPWEIIKHTHGVMFEDNIWIKFKGEDITWQEILEMKLTCQTITE